MRSSVLNTFSNLRNAAVPWAENFGLIVKAWDRKTVKIEFVSGQYTSVMHLVLFGVSLSGESENIDMVLGVAAEAIFTFQMWCLEGWACEKHCDSVSVRVDVCEYNNWHVVYSSG